MSLRFENVPADRAAVYFHAVFGTMRCEFGFCGPFYLLYLHLLPRMETRKCGSTVPDVTTEKLGRRSELKSVYLRARRPEEAALTCVNDLLGTEEGDFHCNNRSCIVLYPL